MKRLLSSLLAVLMLLTCLTACGEAPVSSAGSDQAVSEETAETAAPAPSESPAEASAVSLDEPQSAEDVPAKTVSYPIDGAPVDLTMWTTEPTLGPLRAWGGDYGIDVYEDYSSIQAAAEKTGVNIAFECASQMDGYTLFSLHVAAGDWADILAMVDSYYTGGVSSAYSDDVIMDLSAYAEDWAPDYLRLLSEDADLDKSCRTDDGQILQLCQIYNRFAQVQGYVIRTDWLNQVNTEVPTTVDELHDVLKAFQSQLGCTNPFYYNSACKQLTTAYNAVMYTDLKSNDLGLFQQDGTVYTTFTADNYRDYLRNMHQWYEEGLIDPDFVSVEATDIGGHDEELLRSDNIGVWWANANSISNYYSMCPAENFSIQPLNVYATDDHADHTSSVGRLFGNSTSVAGTCLSATCSNPEAALAWLNFWYTEEGSMLQNYGVEGESYHLVDGKVEYTDVITNSSYGIEPTVALLLYSIGSAPWGVSIQERTWNFYSDVQIDAIETWTGNCDGAWAFPNASLTTEESASISATTGDVCTYIAESIPRFIMGDYNLDTDWDSYVETVHTMGMDQCLGAYQSALDRFNAR